MSATASTHEPISEKQNSQGSLELIRAYSHSYRLAKLVHGLRNAGMLVLALISPVLLFWLPGWADVVGALAGLWVLVGRTVLSWTEDHFVLKGVTIQEQFDVELFDLDWNEALAGPMAAPEDIHSAAQKVKKDKKVEKLKSWYPESVDKAPWPLNVVLCQRSSAAWGRRNHFWYANTVLGLGFVWFVIGVVLAGVAHATLGGYLIKVFLPSQPAFLDTIDLYRGHLRQSQAREAVEKRTNTLWNQGMQTPGSVTAQDCREVQDQAYTVRRRGIQIPQLVYLLSRKKDEEAMRAASAVLVKRLPGGETIEVP